ncbi:PREDICTED: receptor-like protein kinase [Theobroma cacao]|uniref:non-specific serine/threonine protein kinase n=1 Tax=Theobroma cacao TaxID=3641 RepID=A0AB32W3E6_THECC|nr:PREDICTED: receptor-like protein kinase [Theobroma cacao]
MGAQIHSIKDSQINATNRRSILPKHTQLLLPWNQSNSPKSHCQWAGVSCCSNKSFQVRALNLSGFGLSGILNNSVPYLCLHKYMVSLDLSGNSFSGNIPQMLGNCGQLNTILLNDNGFGGSIPHQIFMSKWLRRIDLGYNSLSGEISPEVSLCTNLEYIGLYNNFLTGEAPSGMFSLPNLKFIYLNTNNLTGSLPDFTPSCGILDLWIHENEFSGSLPRTLGNCYNLTTFIASYNNFGGVIPPETFKGLLQLKVLYLDENNLEGEIPDTFWSLENLQELVLSGNKLNGTISERIAQCNQLAVIALSGNNLVGRIPQSIGNLTGLTYLFILNNMLNGSLPPELGNCSSLVELRLQHNFIGGSIPPEICNLESLEVLFMFSNHIEGRIPHGIGRLSNLAQLALYNNSLTGGIPTEIVHLKKLRFLSLAHNDLTGEVQFELRKNFPALVRLDLSGNRLNGSIPSGICAGGDFSVLALGNNRFSGSFPTDIGKCSSLKRVVLSNNLLQGPMPADLEENSGIFFLDVQGNLLEGKIPSVFGHWTNLSMLDFSRNRLSGSIPSELGKLENLQILRVSSNRLTGSIPSELGHCKKIIKLDLSANYLSGSISSEILSSPKLQSLLLQENKLVGIIPDSFSSLQSLLELQLGSNMLQGPIPCSLSNLHHFSSVLNLSNNRLSGEIPACLGKLDKLQILDLSSNSFYGEIPADMNNMISLYFVNISFNHLKGKLPSAWMRIIASYPGSFIGNAELCPLGDEAGYCRELRKGNGRGRVLAGVITAVVVSVALLCAVIYILVVRLLQKKHSYDQTLLHERQSRTEDLPENLKIEDIIRATEGWSDKYIIGRGKHGTVYRTESSDSRNQWAVKKVNLSDTNFRLEMRTLRLIRHRNILRMAGYCIRDGYGFIVTEFMSGGTLFDVLHQSQPRLVLNWDTRHRIAFGIAHGLSYLHHDCVPQIIHRDIKSDNILLDSEFEPKIGDFGIAKLVCDTDSSSTRSAIVGTLGYIAPENAYSTQLTEKCDVYSYGVILLEILCRKLPVDPCFQEGLVIVSWARQNLQDNEEYICFLDEEISLWVNDEQQKALRLLELALHCTQAMADTRPSMRDVVASLIRLNDKA